MLRDVPMKEEMNGKGKEKEIEREVILDLQMKKEK